MSEENIILIDAPIPTPPPPEVWLSPSTLVPSVPKEEVIVDDMFPPSDVIAEIGKSPVVINTTEENNEEA